MLALRKVAPNRALDRGNALGRRLLRPARRLGLISIRPVSFQNREGIAAYNFVLPARRMRSGVTAMIRARNEESRIADCLRSIVHLFDEIVFVDNGSSDDTLAVVSAFKERYDKRDIVMIHEYPHRIARCGVEHWETPEDSVHSLVYYYNWCLAQCTCRYVFKWDADMVVSADGAEEFSRLLDRTRSRRTPPTVWSIPIQTVYRSLDGRWYQAQDDIASEIRLAPNQSAIRYRKAQHWEVLQPDVWVRRQAFHPVCIYELKDTAEDEFDHWTSTEDFPTSRKRREWEHYQQVKAGTGVSSTSFLELSGQFMEVAAGVTPVSAGQQRRES